MSLIMKMDRNSSDGVEGNFDYLGRGNVQIIAPSLKIN